MAKKSNNKKSKTASNAKSTTDVISSDSDYSVAEHGIDLHDDMDTRQDKGRKIHYR